MRAYTGQTRDPRMIRLMVDNDVGVVMLTDQLATEAGWYSKWTAKRARADERQPPLPGRREEVRPPAGTAARGLRRLSKLLNVWPYWFLDNGAFERFKATLRGEAVSGAAWLHVWFESVARLEWASELGWGIGPATGLTRDTLRLPDFVVLPDIVGGGLRSLELSASALGVVVADIQHRAPALQFALVVQEGMTPSDLPWELPWQVLFIGGAEIEWKMGTAPDWIRAARAHGRFVHIGRVGTAGRVREAARLGADSIDSALPLFSVEQAERFIRALHAPIQDRLFD